jgi:hypothetical protein
MVEFMQQGITITTEVYCETQKLHMAIQNKWRVVLLYDNARLRTTVRTQALLEHFTWELSDHLLHSLDLAPSDYHLFIYLQTWFGSQLFNIMRSRWNVSKLGFAQGRKTSY